ncbi:hypothetical protein M3215_07690 [Bacillus cytotoxicus]|uniref:Uncharacterized protein n=1 Tax=Bacillus cytotoxicus TaxID=580165 RepID=A0ACC6A4S2_9BACI|nr:hypothetical protein [Bacillus cytotoxicus]HDX9577621.1 hypothetical protein [Bacillus pseudomycoides]
MHLEQGWKTNFLAVVQQSEYKKGATLAQLLFEDGEEVEELVDDYGYEEIIDREHDEELEETLGEELYYELERNAFLSTQPKEKLISFINGLGFQSLDYIVLLESEFRVDSAMFSSDAIKKMEKRFPKFPYVEGSSTIFEMTLEEAIELVENVTGLSIKEKMNV